MMSSNVVVALNGHSVIIGNVFTRPEWRRRGCYSSLLSGVLREAKASHRERHFYVVVKANNLPSVRTHARLGFVTVASLYYIGVLGAHFLVVAPAENRLRVYRVTSGAVMTL